jgi:RHS repeat-associated protein
VASTTAYDAAGNATLATDPKGNQTVTRFDALNRPLEAIQQSGDATPVVISDQTTGYDEAGDVISVVVDPSGKHLVTSTTYDGAGRKKNVIAPPADPNAAAPDPNGASNVTTYTYDAGSNITDTQVTNPRVSTTGNLVGETTVSYDALGRAHQKVEQAQVQVAEPTVAQTTTFQYDADGRATQTTDANGTTSTGYDAVGRVIGVLHPGSTQPDTSSYDLGNRVTTTTNGSGTTKTYYDALWRVVKEEHYDANNVLISTTSHAYDAQGHELAPVTTLADGTQSGLTYNYDALGRIASVSDNARTYSYDANGQIGSMSVYSDVAKTNVAYQAKFGYDAARRANTLKDLVGPLSTQLHSYSYGYDTANNILTATADGATVGYVYDNLNELTQVTDATGTTSFTYDANHNRTQMVALVGSTSYTTSYTYDAAADTELLSKTDPNGKVTQYTYAAAGNLTKAVYDPTPGQNQTTSYGYDPSGRLNQVTEPDGTTIAFSFDADGNRVKKTVTTGGVTPSVTQVKDVYQSGRIAYQTDGAGVTLATFSYDSNGVPASVQVGSDPSTTPRYYYVYNGHGDVVALTDANGNTVASYSYDAFGGVTATESFANGWTNPYRYDGKDRVRYDTETSLYWMSVRAYDPTLGRFLSRDPLNRQPLVFTGQPYVYAGNNPLKNVDPSGQFYVDPDGTHGAALDKLRDKFRRQYARMFSCDDACRQQFAAQARATAKLAAEQHAKDDAQHTSDVFSDISEWLGWTVWIGVGITAFLGLAAFFDGGASAALAINVGLFSFALLGLQQDASEFASLFSREAGHDPGWFTDQNIESFLSLNKVKITLKYTLGDEGMLIALAAAVTKWGSKALGIATPVFAATAAAALAEAGLYVYALNSETQQENDLGEFSAG